MGICLNIPDHCPICKEKVVIPTEDNNCHFRCYKCTFKSTNYKIHVSNYRFYGNFSENKLVYYCIRDNFKDKIMVLLCFPKTNESTISMISNNSVGENMDGSLKTIHSMDEVLEPDKAYQYLIKFKNLMVFL